jgi:hypothetical protein
MHLLLLLLLLLLPHRFLYLGTYEDEADAARIWDLAALKSRGMSAHTNFELKNYLDSNGDIIAVERLDQAVSRHQAKRNLEPTVSPADKALAVFLGAGAAAAVAAAAAGCGDDDDDDSDWSPDRPAKQQRTRASKRKSAATTAAAAVPSNSMSSSSSGSSSSSNPGSLQVLVPKTEEGTETDSPAAATAARVLLTDQNDIMGGEVPGAAARHSTAADSAAPAAATSDVSGLVLYSLFLRIITVIIILNSESPIALETCTAAAVAAVGVCASVLASMHVL